MYHYTSFKTMFESQLARRGGVIRRKIANIEKYASIRLLIDEVKRRGFHIIVVGDDLLIICNSGNCKLVA